MLLVLLELLLLMMSLITGFESALEPLKQFEETAKRLP